jgi:DNA-binding transcriptional LysR family regulator
MTLTDLGETILPKVISLLEEANKLSAEIEEKTHLPHGEVRIGALPSLYMILGVPLFLEVRKRFPGIRLQIYEGSAGQIDQWVSSGFVDVGLPYRYGDSFSPQIDPLLQVSSYLVGAPGSELTKNPTVPFAKLDNCPLVLPGSPSNVRQALDQLAKTVGIKLDTVLQADSVQIQKAVASLGDVYTVLPAHAVRDEVEAGTLEISQIVDPEFRRTVVVATTQAKPVSRATSQVARLMREIIGQNRSYWENLDKKAGQKSH